MLFNRRLPPLGAAVGLIAKIPRKIIGHQYQFESLLGMVGLACSKLFFRFL